MKQVKSLVIGRLKRRFVSWPTWLFLVLLSVGCLRIWARDGSGRSPVTQRPPQPRIAPSLVACVNCTSRQLRRATMTVVRDVRRGAQELSGGADLWTYPYLHKYAYQSTRGVQIAILVMTSANGQEQRRAIRETWGRESNYPNRTLRVVFFMNMVADERAFRQVEAEAKAYNDVIAQPVGTLASLSSLVTEFVPTHMWSVPLVLVLRRDDCFVNVRALLANARRLINGGFDVAGRRAATSPRNLGGEGEGEAARIAADAKNDIAARGRQEGHGAQGDDRKERRDTDRRDARDRGVALHSTERRSSEVALHSTERRSSEVALHSTERRSSKVALHSTERRSSEVTLLDPCAVLVRGCRLFERLQAVWPLYGGNASSADEMFFSGRLAYAANATVAHLDAFAPCDGGRSSSSSFVRRNDSVTINGLSPAEMRAMHKESIQLASAEKRRVSNETAPDAGWEKGLTPQRLN
ncbi:uncharacterized protein [Dermacentor albipictus]|uniref:uncharacterized protein n=1 Tax=Dermacentor albipictus TaxID=60249 RepID=UPI0031FC05E2